MTLYSHLVVFFFTGFMALTAELAPAAVYLHQTVNSHSHYRSGWKHESTFSSVSNKTCTINSLKTPAASKTKVCAAGFHRGKENKSRKPLNGKTIGLSDKCKKDSDYSPLLFQLLETINDGAVWPLDESTHLLFHHTFLNVSWHEIRAAGWARTDSPTLISYSSFYVCENWMNN